MTKIMRQVIFFSLIGGLFSLIGGLLLIRNRKTADGLAKYATPFAAGVLLGAAFISLIPEALHDADTEAILTTVLLGFLAFFILERFLRFFHHHHEHEAKNKASSSLIIIGDTLHNALDGVAIGAAFLISPSAGIVAAIAVAAHEIPQEIGDFGLLLKNGMAKKKVVIVNILSALATTVAAVLTYALGEGNNDVIPYLLAVTAGFFIYIAASDIIPEIHDSLRNKAFDVRPFLLLVGSILVIIISPTLHDAIEGSADEKPHSTHSDYVIKQGEPVPSIELTAEKSESGLTVYVKPTNFEFTPEHEGEPASPGQGHAHLYINDTKITRLYSEWTFVPMKLLSEHFDKVTVTLSNNDHAEYHAENGVTISSTVEITNNETEDKSHTPMDSH